MYEYFGVGPEIQEEFSGIFPRFLRWLPKHRFSIPSKRSLEIWCLVINNLTIDVVNSLAMFKSVVGEGGMSSRCSNRCYSDNRRSRCLASY